MEVDLVLAADQGERLVHIGAQLVGRAGGSGIVAGGLNAAGQLTVAEQESLDIVALPAVHGNFDVGQAADGLLGVGAERRVALSGFLIASHMKSASFKKWCIASNCFPLGIYAFGDPPAGIRPIGKERRTAARASAAFRKTPPAIIWASRLPTAVPSEGPVEISRPVAAAVRRFR